MDSFEIRTVLIYNPTLKSANRKALQDEIQDTKILYYYPKSSDIEQKRFHVGMAQGTYSFLDSMLTQQQQSPRYQVIHTKSEIYINKQVEQNIWLFLGIRKSDQKLYSNEKKFTYLGEQTHKYDQQIFNEQICLKIINHYYINFRTFNGYITTLVNGRQNVQQLQKVMTQYLSRYIYLNEYKNKLEISFYEFQGLRMVPLDHNYCLKFNYFHSSSKNFDPSIEQTIIFFNGYVVFTSLSPQDTLLFYNYYYSQGQPFQFDESKLLKKFSHVANHNALTQCKYGYFINCSKYGIQKKVSEQVNQDLLGLQQQEVVKGIEILMTKQNNNKQFKQCYLTTYHQNKLLFVNLCSRSRAIEKVHLHNRLIKDNIQKFYSKISSIITPLSNQQEIYKFIYLNLSTMGGKFTFQFDDTEVHNSIKLMLLQMKNKPEITLLHTAGAYSIYGTRRVSRIVILILNNEIPIQRIQQNFQRLSKDYFGTIYI